MKKIEKQKNNGLVAAIKRDTTTQDGGYTPRTFLCECGVATVGVEHTRDNYDKSLIEAPNLAAARRWAWHEHCPECLEDNDGHWINYNGHRAYQLSADCPDVDAKSIYWVEKLVELPPEEAVVLVKYLGVSRAKTATEVAQDEKRAYDEFLRDRERRGSDRIPPLGSGLPARRVAPR